MADNFNRKQVFEVFAEKFLQTRYLAWRPRKQHKASAFQEIGSEPKRIADTALHILAARKRIQLSFGLRICMANIQIFVERRPENYTAARNYISCKQRENSAR